LLGPAPEPADPDTPRLASRRIGMKDRQTLRFSFVRGWASALLSRSRHKSYYTQSRPIPGTRFAGPPVTGPRRLLVLPARRPGSLSITASCVQTGCFTVTLTAIPDLAFVRAVRAPARRHPSRQNAAPPELNMAGSASPIPPPIPRCSPPFHPQEGLRPKRQQPVFRSFLFCCPESSLSPSPAR